MQLGMLGRVLVITYTQLHHAACQWWLLLLYTTSDRVPRQTGQLTDLRISLVEACQRTSRNVRAVKYELQVQVSQVRHTQRHTMCFYIRQCVKTHTRIKRQDTRAVQVSSMFCLQSSDGDHRPSIN
jgi:hypothetical protein